MRSVGTPLSATDRRLQRRWCQLTPPGGCADPTYSAGQTTRGAEARHAPTFNPDHSMGVDQLVMDNTVECPEHSGRFDYTNGKALGAPGCLSLRTYPVKVEDGHVLVDVG